MTQNQPSLTQVGLLQSLMNGNFSGCITAGELKALGDTGLGTFDSIDGELILLEGTVYQAKADGSVLVPGDGAGVTFAGVTFFAPMLSAVLSPAESLAELEAQLNALLPEKNYFYSILFHGSFPAVTVRSETPQQTSHRPLSEVMETAQTVHSFQNLTGTLVGQFCPAYMEGFQVCGWHFHFLSQDRKQGGHVLSLCTGGGSVSFSESRSLTLHLPQDAVFRGLDLSADHRSAIAQLERGG